MSKYRIHSIPQELTIGGQRIRVDSKLEATVIQWLEANGYSGCWRRSDKGLHAGGANYTPDLELGVELDGKTYLALIEIKPALHFMTPYIKRRMIATSKHYFAELLFVYADKEKQWYRLDKTSHELFLCELPPPSRISENKLYRPLSLAAPSVGNHTYKRRWEVEKIPLKLFATCLETLIMPLQKGVQQSARKGRRRVRRKRGFL